MVNDGQVWQVEAEPSLLKHHVRSLTQLYSVDFLTIKDQPLFVFSMVGPKQNAGPLSTPVSDTVFDALSHGTLGFALHGSYLNHFLIGGISSPANQIR